MRELELLKREIRQITNSKKKFVSIPPSAGYKDIITALSVPAYYPTVAAKPEFWVEHGTWWFKIFLFLFYIRITRFDWYKVAESLDMYKSAPTISPELHYDWHYPVVSEGIRDRIVIQATKKAVGKAKTVEEKVVNIHNWIFNNIPYNKEYAYRDKARDILDGNGGVCTDFAVITACMLTIEGIPNWAKNIGWKDVRVSHIYNLAKIGNTWKPVDSTCKYPFREVEYYDAYNLMEVTPDTDHPPIITPPKSPEYIIDNLRKLETFKPRKPIPQRKTFLNYFWECLNGTAVSQLVPNPWKLPIRLGWITGEVITPIYLAKKINKWRKK